jgi:hypothetical protein
MGGTASAPQATDTAAQEEALKKKGGPPLPVVSADPNNFFVYTMIHAKLYSCFKIRNSKKNKEG